MIEAIRFWLCAALLAFGALDLFAALIGLYRYDFALNRMHFTGMFDSLGIFAILSGLIIMRGISFDSLKLLLVLVILWQSAPISSHMLALLEYRTDPELFAHAKLPERDEEE